MIRLATPADAQEITGIYNHYVLKTTVTFEEQPVNVPDMAQRIEETLSSHSWFVYIENSRIVGYSYAAKYKARSAFRRTAESTVYLTPDSVGRGLGTKLYSILLDDLRARAVHTVIGIVALPNPASMALHERLGFHKVGALKEVGWKFDRWIDVDYWQLILSPSVP